MSLLPLRGTHCRPITRFTRARDDSCGCSMTMMSPRSGGWNANSALSSPKSGTNGISPVSASGLSRENTSLLAIKCCPSTRVEVMLKCMERNTASDTNAVCTSSLMISRTRTPPIGSTEQCSERG